MLAAFHAGHMPDITPIVARITNAIIITFVDVLRKMSPS